MNIFNENFTKQPASKQAQYLAMAVFLIISLPILWQLSTTIMVVVLILWFFRVALIMMDIRSLPSYIVLLVAGFLMAVVVWQFKRLWGQDGGIAFLLFMVLMKSFESKTIRDWQALLLGTLFLTVITLIFSQDIFNAFWTAFNLFLVLSALNMLDGGSWHDAFRQSWRGLLFALPFAIILFIAIPRLPEPLIRLMPNEESMAKVGLTEHMSPGQFGELLESNEAVFNASFESSLPPIQQLYWRTLILPDFDGKTWHAKEPFMLQRKRSNHGSKVSYSLLVKEWKGHIPALDYPIDTNQETQIVDGSLVMVSKRYGQLRRVDITSSLSDRQPENLPQQLQNRLIYLPDAAWQTRDLAQRLYRESVDNQDYIQRVLRYFAQQGFAYTLKPPTLTTYNDETDAFMFETKQGFCGHYASAFAVMMRAAKIPARVVAGYQGGSDYPSARLLTVRSKDAHAWVEVWLPENQTWQRIDPTAVISARANGIDSALPATERIGNKIPLGLSGLLDKTRFYWQTWVVDFDAHRQNNLFKNIGLGSVHAGSVLMVLLLGSALTLAPMLLWWKKRLQRQSNPLVDGFMQLKSAFLQYEEDINTFGPLDLKNHLYEQGLLEPTIEQLLQKYIILRYQDQRSSEKQMQQWHQEVKRLVKKIKKQAD